MAVVARFVLVAFLSCWAAGCADVEGFRSDAANLRDTWAAQSAVWEHRLAAMPPNDPMRPDAEAALARAKAKEAAADAAVKQVDLVVARAQHPDEPLGQSVGMLSPLLPEPIRWPLALGAALVASLIRARQLKDGLASVATGLDKAMQDDPQFEAGFKKHANTFRSIQTPAAQKVIDQTQRRRARRKAA